MSESLSVDCCQALERAAALLEVEGSYVLRAQAQQQAALELLQARKLGADDRVLQEVLLERIRTAVAEVVGPEAPCLVIPEQEPPERPGSTALPEEVEALIARLEADSADAPLASNPWSLAVACHQRMLSLDGQDRMAGITHAVAGARLIGSLRDRGVALPDWLMHHEEQLCRYGGLWIHQRLLESSPDDPIADGGTLARQGVLLLSRLQAIHGDSHAWIGHHLAALQQEVSRTAAGRPLTLAMAGNCQYWPLYQYLKALLTDVRLEPGPTVHLATPEEVEAFQGLLASVDVLLIHRIQPGYRNGIGLDNRTLASHLPPSARQLLLPNIHYEGHHPWIGYAHDPHGQLPTLAGSSPLGAYHDFLAMQAAQRGLAAADILSAPLTPELAGQIRQHHLDSLEQLRRREADCAVAISPWIAQHHRRVPVAHTCNHPTHAALHALLLQLLERLDLDVAGDPLRLESREYLGELSIPILPWVRHSLQLEAWAEGWGRREGQGPFPIEAQLTESIAFYREHPWIAEHNQHHDKFRWAGSVLASLTGAP